MITKQNKTENNITEIAVISDRACVHAAIVMLTSAKTNKYNTSHYRVHFICIELSQFHKNKIKELESKDFEILLYDANTDYYKSVPIKIHVTAATFLKVDLPQLLPNVDKVLHIDADALVYKDLTTLYSTDIGHFALGVVKSLYLQETDYITRLGVKNGFNAGIMLMNLSLWREMTATKHLQDMLLQIPEDWHFLEQDCMSVYFQKQLYFLAPRNNACPYVWKQFNIQEINQFYGTDYASKDDLLDDAVILHLAGTPNVRPWQVINGVYGAVWQYYYDLSPLRHVHIERPDIFCPPMKKEQLTMKSEIALLKKDSSIRAKEYNSFKESKENMVLINLYTRILYRYRLLQFKHFLSWGKRRVRYAKQKRHLKSLLQKARAARKIFFQVLMETSGI